MCGTWPCCEPRTYTVRKYRADGTTAWVADYAYPAAPANAAPTLVRVGSDGRVFVSGPRVVWQRTGHPDIAWSVRCFDDRGQPLWTHDCLEGVPTHVPPVGDIYARPIDLQIDGADNVYLLVDVLSGINEPSGSILEVLSKDGMLLDRSGIAPTYAEAYWEFSVGHPVSCNRLAVSQAGDVAAVGGTVHEVVRTGGVMGYFNDAAWRPAGQLAAAGTNFRFWGGGTDILAHFFPLWNAPPPPEYIVEFPITGPGNVIGDWPGPFDESWLGRHVYVHPDGPGDPQNYPDLGSADIERLVHMVCDGHDRLTVAGDRIWNAGRSQSDTLAQYRGEDLQQLWTRPGNWSCGPHTNAAGRIAIGRLNLSAAFPPRRRPNLQVFNHDGSQAWAHAHGFAEFVRDENRAVRRPVLHAAVGALGDVATVCAPALRDTKWEQDFIPDSEW